MLGDPKEAASMFEQVAATMSERLGEEDERTLISVASLGAAYHKVGELQKAANTLRKALDGMRSHLGPSHPESLLTLNNLAIVYRVLDRHAESLQLYEESYSLLRKKLGADHPQTIHSLHEMGHGYEHTGRIAEAIQILKKTYEFRTDRLGESHCDTLQWSSCLIAAYFANGELLKAEPLLQSALRARKNELGVDHPETLGTTRGYVDTLIQNGKFSEAKDVCNEWIAVLDRSKDQAQYGRAQTTFAEILLNLKENDRALDAVSIAMGIEELDRVQRLRASSIKGAALAAKGRTDAAEALLVGSAEELRDMIPSMGIVFRWHAPKACERVIAAYKAWGNSEEVEIWEKRLLDLKEQIEDLRDRT